MREWFIRVVLKTTVSEMAPWVRIPLPPHLTKAAQPGCFGFGRCYTVGTMAKPVPREVTWEAPEHHHVEKNGDWFWILGILTIIATVTAFFLGNTLFALLLLIAGVTTGLVANREPDIIPFAVNNRGIRVADTLYPYSTLECFYLDEEHERGPQLLARSTKLFMPLIIMPIPAEYIEEIETILEPRLPEEHLEEPLANKLLEIFGF